MMKQLTIVGAVAAALCSGQAFALPQNAINPLVPTANDLVIHWSGATAQQLAVRNLAAQYCNGGYDEYNNGLLGDTVSAMVITCTTKNAAPVPALAQGKNLYFSYYLDGGSIYGVTPVADQIPLNYMAVNTLQNGSCNAGTVSGANTVHKCENVASRRYAKAPIAGSSDVEPALFKGSNVAGLAFGAPLNPSALSPSRAFNVVFGVGVNLALLDGTVYPGGTGTIKSLSKSSLASIFTGKKAQWDAIPEFGGMEAYWDGASVPTDIHVCRRKAGSGTQASAQAYFLGEECSSHGQSFATASTWPVPGELEEISSSSSILSACLNTNPRALALSSLEKLPGGSSGTNWAYVAIDGIMPTTENAAKGLYDYMFENSMQYNKNVVLSGTKEYAFITDLFAKAAEATPLVGTNGVLAIPSTTNLPGDQADSDGDTLETEYLASNPVAWTTRNGDACSAPTQVFP